VRRAVEPELVAFNAGKRYLGEVALVQPNAG
jgi:hypothetical protein